MNPKIRVVAYFAIYVMLSTFFIASLFLAVKGAGAFAILNIGYIAVTFSYAYLCHDQIEKRPGLMLSFFVFLCFSTIVVGALFMSRFG